MPGGSNDCSLPRTLSMSSSEAPSRCAKASDPAGYSPPRRRGRSDIARSAGRWVNHGERQLRAQVIVERNLIGGECFDVVAVVGAIVHALRDVGPAHPAGDCTASRLAGPGLVKDVAKIGVEAGCVIATGSRRSSQRSSELAPRRSSTGSSAGPPAGLAPVEALPVRATDFAPVLVDEF